MSNDFSLPPNIFFTETTFGENVRNFLKDRNIWIIGGTGIIGTWLTSRILFESQTFKLNTQIWISSRDIVRTKTKFKDYSKSSIKYLSISKNNMELPKSNIDLIIFGATPSKSIINSNEIVDIVQASKNYLESIRSFCINQSQPLKILNLSSGAVIARNTELDFFIPERRALRDEDLKNSRDWYSNLKIDLEESFLEMANNIEISVTNARLFNVTGYGLPLDAHFAWGQFMKMCLKGLPPKISGNPNTERSFLSLDETALALMVSTLGNFEIVNIGGAERISMKTLANRFCEYFKLETVLKGDESIPAGSYVPNLSNLSKLGFKQEKNTVQQIAHHAETLKVMSSI